MSEKITVKLSKPFENSQGTLVSELEIREPNFKDLRMHGLPVGTDGTVDFEKASKLLEALTGIQRPYLDKLNMKDSMAAVKAMVKQFKLTEEDAKN